MTLEQFKELTLTEMKLVAKDLGIRGFANIATKDKMVEKVEAHLAEFELEELPDLSKKDSDEEPTTLSTRPTRMARKRIDSFPRKKVLVLSRDPDVVDYPFGINEYTCMVQMNKPVLLPEPIIELIKSTTEVAFRKDPETGFSKHEEVPKFVVQYL